ncbi:helix-turn-helix transcriptional regulator [Porphyrobacter sp. CACIAM 03H1]|uniref:helix-turn-helix transcriptional regulator n=1 Tax=Porphyrobacter sp. CACIAM 03H1 TaxID=2003315 RepID=UPI000B5A5A3B|nr:helix-turn-helix transcriptional regulator [Porphyrobacter sp. CACIAM 03H1]ASJ90960.1 transcriptional regulator [Porphyrobacter sp. CACIAM 03H1]
MTERSSTTTPLGAFLRDRRARMDPASFGFGGRRRTPGLRREEVAQRANISPTWYTWLEQGRGGSPSADVLDRLAKGLMLTEPEREHLFLLALGRPPAVTYSRPDHVTPRLQRVLDALPNSPAIIKTATWDVIAWNAAAARLLTDYGSLPREERNVLRLIFTNPVARTAQDDWWNVARYVVGAFRADAARAGAGAEIKALVDELSRISPEFESLWRENDVASHADGMKRLRHPEHGIIELEFSAFAVEGRPDLGMLVYNPATPEAARRVAELLSA